MWIDRDNFYPVSVCFQGENFIFLQGIIIRPLAATIFRALDSELPRNIQLCIFWKLPDIPKITKKYW